MVSETKYSCYGFKLELEDGPLVTWAYASSHLSINEAELDIKKRFAPHSVSACILIEDPMKDIVSLRQSNKEYYDEIYGGIKSTKDLSSKRKRRVGNDSN